MWFSSFAPVSAVLHSPRSLALESLLSPARTKAWWDQKFPMGLGVSDWGMLVKLTFLNGCSLSDQGDDGQVMGWPRNGMIGRRSLVIEVKSRKNSHHFISGVLTAFPSLYCYHGTFQSVCSQTKLIMASLSHFVYKHSA